MAEQPNGSSRNLETGMGSMALDGRGITREQNGNTPAKQSNPSKSVTALKLQEREVSRAASPGVLAPDAVRREDAIRFASNWIINSGVQDEASDSQTGGGFYAWIDLDLGRCRYLYPEITGYGITALLYLESLGGSPEGASSMLLSANGSSQLVDKACQAGDWILRHALEEDYAGVCPRGHYDQQNLEELFSPNKHVLVTFDSAMVLFGLTNLYYRTRRARYFHGARRVADFMITQAQKEDGLFYPCFEPETRRWSDTPEKWSTQSCSYHAKLSLGLLHMYQLTGQDQYQTAVDRLCRAAMSFQLPSGRFVTFRKGKEPQPNPLGGATHMHPHLYSAEGLLTAGITMKRPEFIESAVRAVEWALNQQLPDGGLPCLVGPDLCNAHQRSDTLAQALRLGAMCYALGELSGPFVSRLAELERKLIAYQHLNTTAQARNDRDGGFYYGCDTDGKQRPHLNFWCTAFALQAIILYRDLVLGGRASRPEALTRLFI